LVHFVLPFSLAAVISAVLMPVARGVGWVDSPGARKRHHGPTPLVGGVAIFLAIVVSALFSGLWQEYKALIAFGAMSLVFGLYDDVRPLSAMSRLILQGVAAAMAVFAGGVLLHDVGNLLATGIVTLGVLAVPVTIFCIVGVMNAMNMSDGMDGSAGGLALVTLLSMAYLAVGIRHAEFLLLVAAAVAGFMVLNMRSPVLRRAKIFMGDAGSLMLGGILAWFLIDLSQGPERAFSPVVALWLFALPLLDTVSLMILRVLKGRSPFSPGREHFHHILLRAGFSVGEAGSMLIGLAVILAMVGVLGNELSIPEWTLFVAFIVLFAGSFWGMSRASRLVRYFRRKRGGKHAASVQSEDGCSEKENPHCDKRAA